MQENKVNIEGMETFEMFTNRFLNLMTFKSNSSEY